MLKIFNFYHKPFHIFQTPNLIPIHAGKSISPHNLNMLSDNTNENISYKNKNYGELTGMYWVLKNIKESHIGFCHYRRYFNFHTKRPFDFIYLTSLIGKPEIFTPNENILKYDIIVPIPIRFETSIASQYIYNHRKTDWDTLMNIIQKRYPNYPLEIIHKNRLYPFNMFIMKYHIFQIYMDFVFDLLNELESKITLPPNNNYQCRVFGFIAERLLTIFLDMIQHNQFNISNLSILEMQTLFVKNIEPINLKLDYNKGLYYY